MITADRGFIQSLGSDFLGFFSPEISFSLVYVPDVLQWRK